VSSGFVNDAIVTVRLDGALLAAENVFLESRCRSSPSGGSSPRQRVHTVQAT